MILNLPTIKNLKSLLGQVVLVRVDYNLPICNSIVDDSRILATIPTLKLLLKLNAKIVLISHFGRPNFYDECFSLKFIRDKLQNLLKMNVEFISESIYSIDKKHFLNSDNRIFLLENIRFYQEETNNDIQFAKSLSLLGDIFVNEALSVSHRHHASIVSILQFLPCYFGLHFVQELNFINKFTNESNSLAIVGGNKIIDKIKLIKSLLSKNFKIFLVGGIGNLIMKFLHKKQINISSQIEDTMTYLAQHKNIILPSDVVIFDGIHTMEISNLSQLLPNHQIVDCGSKTLNKIHGFLNKIKFVFWNGPIGIYENSKFSKGTKRLIDILIKYTKKGGKTLLGGGHTVSAINQIAHFSDFTYVSSSGGACLHFMSYHTLPAIQALKNNY